MLINSITAKAEAKEGQSGQPASRRENHQLSSVALVGSPSGAGCSKGQLSSFVLFVSLVLLINLCPPFELDFGIQPLRMPNQRQCLGYFESSLQFVRLMFRNPMRMEARATRYTLAEARVLGKMAKVWYIKKKIKKLGKKLKKHTIAVPMFTAIPIYEHSYYPSPHVTHVSHGGGMHHAAASSYAPTVAQVASSAAASSSSAQQQMVAAASSQHPAAYRMAPAAAAHHAHPMSPYAQHGHGHIINAYTPSQPLFVDDTGGLYGHYGNAYGRYDGGYHVW